MRSQLFRRRLLTASVLAVALSACGTTEDRATSTALPTTTTIATTTIMPATTTVPATTTTRATTTTGVPTTTTEMVDISVVVAWIQQWLDDAFTRSDPPEGVTGAFQLECEDKSPIRVGEVFACLGKPQTEGGFQLDPVGLVIYVLDGSGRAVWESGTDLPNTTGALLNIYQTAPHGRLCRDLIAPDNDMGLFDGTTRPADAAYFWSLVYWSLEGEPARMDEDGNRIPCETVHDAEIVAAVLEGGPVPLHLR